MTSECLEAPATFHSSKAINALNKRSQAELYLLPCIHLLPAHCTPPRLPKGVGSNRTRKGLSSPIHAVNTESNPSLAIPFTSHSSSSTCSTTTTITRHARGFLNGTTRARCPTVRQTVRQPARPTLSRSRTVHSLANATTSSALPSVSTRVAPNPLGAPCVARSPATPHAARLLASGLG